MLKYIPVLALFLALPAGATTYNSIQSDTLIGHDNGPDGLWGTADDGVTAGVNSLGHANQGVIFDANGDLVAFGAGPQEIVYPDFTLAVNVGTVTNHSVTTTNVDTGVTTADDPAQSPHQQRIFDNNTFDFAHTNVSCAGPAGCADPLVVVEISGVGFYWTAEEDPTLIDEITMSVFGDLSSYALSLEALAPDDATAYLFTFGANLLTPDNVSGLLVTDDWFGGTSLFSTALFTTDPLTSSPIPEPATSLLIGLGLLGLATRRASE